MKSFNHVDSSILKLDFHRVAASVRKRLAPALILFTFLFGTYAPQMALAVNVSGHMPPPPSMPASVRKGPVSVTLITPKMALSDNPSDAELEAAHLFQEPLCPLSSHAVAGENKALANAINAYKHQPSTRDLTCLSGFLHDYPTSRWRASVQLHIAQIQYESGYTSKALDQWKSIWEEAKAEHSPKLKAIADEAMSQLLLLNARLGRTKELQSNLAAVGKRHFLGSSDLRLAQADAGMHFQKDHPGIAYKCGPFAVNSILNIDKAVKRRDPVIDKCKSTSAGTNLLQVKQMADKVGLKYQIAKRAPGAVLMTPCVVHWKLSHFAAVTKHNGELYQVEDPTFDEKGNLWVKPDVFDSESDGYFLVAAGPLPKGWTPVNSTEAQSVWGRGISGPSAGGKTGCLPHCVPCGDAGCGMTRPDAFKLNATLNLKDTPVGYSPPVGPKINFNLNYNDQEGNQPASFTFSNFGQDWTVNWGAYLTLDLSQNATVRPPGGGYEIYNYTSGSPYPPDPASRAVLTLVSAGVYQRFLPDGSIQVYNQADGTGRIFMTQLLDPQGNSAYIQYDTNFRIVSVTDAIGQVSTFSYVSNTIGNSGFYLISAITDPFGRAATFAYDSTNTFLVSITDVIGITSSFKYDPSSSSVSYLTTPYGATAFLRHVYQDGIGNTITSLKTNYPDGTSTVINNSYGYNTESFWWDRESMMLYPYDYQTRGYPGHSENSQWETSMTYIPQPVADSTQPPLDATYNYTYAGEGTAPDGLHNVPGPLYKPITVSRAFGGSTQTFSYQYNSLGKMTQSIDPAGRTFSYLYATNNIDLLEKRQVQGTNNDLLGKWIFSNTQHVPNEYIDGSGQQTYYAYNTRGQLTTLTDANGSIWTRSYNNDGFLTQIDGPLAGNADVTTFAYDGYNRLYSVTDSEGYTKIFNYDNADRITQVTYPDSTTEVTVYNKLDAVMRKDRINRWTQDSYDSMDQLAFEIDPLGRKTEYSWCACGSMSSLTDGNGNTTTFNHDQNGRLATKTYADTSTLNYTYDSLGRLSTRVDALGQNTTYSYNLDNTLSGIAYNYAVNPTSNVTYTWDPNYVRLSTVANGWGTYTYNYNAYITSPTAPPITGGGMLATVLNSTIPNATTAYFYDALGRTTSRQINGTSNSVTWGYDKMSRVTSEANALGTFAYHYVDDVSGASKGTSRLASINYPNGQITNFSWYGTSQDERLQGITNLDPTGKTRSQFNYGYDSAGEIVSWPQQNAGMSPVNYALGYDPAGQLVSAQGSTNTTSPAANISNYSYDSAANRTAAQTSNIQTARISGTITAGNTVTITVSDTGLSGGQEAVTYTVFSGDTATAIATKLAAAISADANLQTLGVNASAASSLIKIRSVSPNITTYAASTSVGATEVVTLNVSGNQIQNAVIGTLGAGYQTRANDVLTLKVFDAGLTGGVESVTYTIPSDNTSLPTAASGLAAAVNADTHLSTLGVTATSASSVLSLKSSSVNLTTYAAAVTPTTTSATETIAVGTNPVGNTNATVGGTVTTGDVVTLTAQSKSLTGSTETVQYKVPSSATTTTIATGLAAAINADTKFVSYGLTATSSGAVVTISSSPTYSKSTSGGATETVTLGTNVNGNSSATIGGTVTAGNTVTVKVSGAGLAAARSETYTVLSGDTLSTIASGLSAVINADATVKTLGVSALAVSGVITISYNPINYALYRASVTGGATETVTLLMNSNVNQIGVVAGTITAGDVVSITTTDFGLTGGTETTSYTVASGNTLTNVASGLTSAINADTNLQAIGVFATSSGTAITLSSSSPNITKFGSFANSAATEAVTIGTNLNGVQTAIVGGTKTTGNVLSLTVFDAGLSTGKETVSYTVVAADTLTTIATALTNAINADTNLQAIGVSATSSSTVVNIKSTSTNATTYLQSLSSGATETLALSTGTGVSEYRNNELNQLINISPGGQVNVQAVTNKPVKSASVNGQVVSIASTPPVSPFLATYTSTTNNPDFGSQFMVSNFLRGSAQFVITGFHSGPSTVGTLYSVIVSHPALPNGQKTVTYTTVLGDTYASVASGVSAVFNADTNLQSIGLSSTAASQTVTATPTFPTYTGSTSGGATETLTSGQTYEGQGSIAVGGTATTGDVLSIVVHYPGLTGLQETVSYTVLASDTLASIATGLAAALNADTHLQAIDLTSSTVNQTVLTSAKTFSSNPMLPQGYSSLVVSAVDGGSNTKSNSYQISAKGSANQPITYDRNGNMTSDGTNSYLWDAENRLVQINYPGTGNNSQFVYDGFGRNVDILENLSGSLTSTKQFVWNGQKRREARNASGAITAQYFDYGQTIAGLNYFYTQDHLASIREISDISGNIQSALGYDPFGITRRLQGTLVLDFQYASYYNHSTSGLNFAVNRAYSSIFARWINRDPMGDLAGANLYVYVLNNPINKLDPSGLASFVPPGITPPSLPRLPDPKIPCNCFSSCGILHDVFHGSNDDYRICVDECIRRKQGVLAPGLYHPPPEDHDAPPPPPGIIITPPPNAS